MDSAQFFSRVLPADGKYFFGVIHQGRYIQRPCKNQQELNTGVQKATQYDSYFSVGSYTGNKREAASADKKKCFYVDIDLKEKVGYATKKESITALHQFTKTTELPFPNILVDSGGGIHAYWVLEDEIAASEWVEVATALKNACQYHDFKVDHACTADAARILRVPDTYNNKYSTSVQCKVVREIPDDYSFSQIATPLANYISDEEGALKTRPAREDSVNDDLSAGVDYDRTYHFPLVVKQCGVMQHICSNNGEDCHEPLWMQTLNLLAFTENGEKYIHYVSKGHAGYTPKATVAKYRHRQDAKAKGSTGPTLCSTFEESYPEICAQCPHKNKIKTPLVLGDKEDTRNAFGDDDAEAEQSKNTRAAKMPRYYRNTEYGVERKVEDRWEPVFPYQILDFQAYFDPDANGIILSFLYQMRRSEGSCEIPLKILSDSRALAGQLSIYGIALHRKQQMEFSQLMTTWYQQMQEAKQVKQTNPRLGWIKREGLTGFATSDRVLWENGNETRTVMVDKKIKSHYSPKGEYEPWRKAAQFVLDQGNPESAAVIATGFAAPLIKYSGVSGVMFSVISQKSGTGKTTALKIAQAIWGCPRRAINALNDTPMSVAHKLGTLNNLPAYWDELRMQEDVKQFIKLLFQIGQGKEKSRLTSSVTQQEMGTWETMITVASNESLLDHVDQMVQNTDAGRLRVFEIEMMNHISSRNLAESNRMFLPLADNYGHAGEMYAKYLAENYERVGKLLTDTIEMLTNKLVASTDERFWVCMVASIIVGARVATESGIVQFDVKALTKYLVGELHNMRGEVREEFESDTNVAINHLFIYLNQRQPHTAVVEHRAHKNKPQGAIKLVPDKAPAHVVISEEERIVRIDYRDFREWLYKNSQSPSWVIAELEREGATAKRGVMCQGLPNAIDSRIKIIDVPLADNAVGKMIGELTDDEQEK